MKVIQHEITPVNVTEPNGIKFALAIIADAKRAAINNFSFMLLVSLTCTNYARVKVLGCFGDKNMCSSFAPLASPHKQIPCELSHPQEVH
jgi:hypothetical protein